MKVHIGQGLGRKAMAHTRWSHARLIVEPCVRRKLKGWQKLGVVAIPQVPRGLAALRCPVRQEKAKGDAGRGRNDEEQCG